MVVVPEKRSLSLEYKETSAKASLNSRFKYPGENVSVGVSEIDRAEESATCRDTEEEKQNKKTRKQHRVQKLHNESTHTHTQEEDEVSGESQREGQQATEREGAREH